MSCFVYYIVLCNSASGIMYSTHPRSICQYREVTANRKEGGFFDGKRRCSVCEDFKHPKGGRLVGGRIFTCIDCVKKDVVNIAPETDPLFVGNKGIATLQSEIDFMVLNRAFLNTQERLVLSIAKRTADELRKKMDYLPPDRINVQSAMEKLKVCREAINHHLGRSNNA